MSKSDGSNTAHTPTVENRKARHDFHISETVECGIALVGSEVKSIRAGHISLGEGYARVDERTGELWLHNIHIGEYAPSKGSASAHAPIRDRKLLAHSREIRKLADKTRSKGSTLIPLKLYFKDGWAKILLGVAEGKQKGDRREDEKKKEARKEIQRAMTRKRLG